MNKPIKYTIMFIGLLFFQVLILNNVNINGIINPYVYPLFILLLPFEISGALLLVLAFFTGFIIDVFMGTIGIHAFASVFLAAARPSIIGAFSKRNIEQSKQASINENGFSWVLFYTSSLIFIHHTIYFLIESSSFSNIGTLLLRIVCSSLISIFFIFMLLFAFKKAKKRR